MVLIGTVHVGAVWWEADAATNNKLISIHQRVPLKLHSGQM